MLPLRVFRREVVGEEVVTFFLTAPGKQGAPAAYLPGQFVTLAIPTPTEILYRSFSLCGSGSLLQPWEITIKKVSKGRVSTWLHDHVGVGATLYASLPRGTFVLPTPLRRDTPIIFVAAGSGITPIRGMIRALAQIAPQHRPHVQLHYASKTPEDIIYQQEWPQLDPQRSWLWQWHYLSSQGQKMSSSAILERSNPIALRAHWYVCGPDSLRNDLMKALMQRGLPADHIHVEVFATQRTPSQRVWGGGAAPRTPGQQIYVQETGSILRASQGETILETLERHGYQAPFSCRTGTCGTCRLQLLAGRVDATGDQVLSAGERRTGGVLSCVSKPVTDIALLSGGRAPRGARAGVVPSASRTMREPARSLTRMACVAAVGIGFLGAWNLTNHFPPSLVTNSSSNNGGNSTSEPGQVPTTDSGNPFPTATPGTYPTATPQPGYPTATPQPNPPTATPRPQPTATPRPRPTATTAPSR